mgnify:CR=1 FL=1
MKRAKTLAVVMVAVLPFLAWAAQPEHKGQVLVMPVSNQIPHYVGRLITVMAVPTYEMSVDDTHPHPSGAYTGVLVFYIDTHALTKKFTQGIRSGKTGYAWIMNSDGTFLNHPERDFIGKNAFTVRKERMPAISFDAINQIQREKMLTGKEGWGAYLSGWHRGMAGEIQKLMAYAPVQLDDQNLVQENKPAISWSVAVVAPASEVEGVIHTLYTRQFYLQVIIGLVVGAIAALLWFYRRTRLGQIPHTLPGDPLVHRHHVRQRVEHANERVELCHAPAVAWRERGLDVAGPVDQDLEVSTHEEGLIARPVVLISI